MTPPSRRNRSDDQLVRIALRHHRALPDESTPSARLFRSWRPLVGRSLSDANTPLGATHYDPLLAKMMTPTGLVEAAWSCFGIRQLERSCPWHAPHPRRHQLPTRRRHLDPQRTGARRGQPRVNVETTARKKSSWRLTSSWWPAPWRTSRRRSLPRASP